VATKNSGRSSSFLQNVAGLFSGRLAHYLLPSTTNPKMPMDLDVQPSGFRSLDKAMGVGGLPRGYLTELVAPGPISDSSGTLSIMAQIAAKAQHQQQLVTLIDLTQQFDPWLAERCGVAAPHLLLKQPETLFETLTLLEQGAQEEGLVVVITGLVSTTLSHIEPRPLHTFLRRLRSIIKNSHSVFLAVTTPLEEDPFSPANYPPGFPLADLAAVRLWVQAENWTYQGGLASGYKAMLAVIKNQLAPVGSGAEIKIKFTRF
jgi:recombination protein RecA